MIPGLRCRLGPLGACATPTAPEEISFTGLLNAIPKYVASRTLTGPLAWHRSELLAGDLAESITDVKARHDEVHVIGSLDLVQSLLRLGLVDRLNLWQFPLCSAAASMCSPTGPFPPPCI
jgi:dihydrofolate reductase